MSKWYDSKLEDIDIDGDEINIWIEQTYEGNVYVTVKVEDIKKVLNIKN